MCTRESHETAKADDAAWGQMEFIGNQSYHDDEVVIVLSMRNCRRCGSTLARTVLDARTEP